MSTQEDADKIKVDLATFLKNNPNATVDLEEKSSLVVLNKPWNDDTIGFNIPAEIDVVKALNSLILPERFSAIYHVDSKSLEFIYSIFPPSGDRSDIATRKFEITHRGKNFACEFSHPSSELFKLATCFRPVAGSSDTNYRNLLPFNALVYAIANAKRKEEPVAEPYRDAKPISFWVKGIEWNDEEVLDLVMHLNFYMYYFDRETPTVLIHTPASEGRAHNPQTRFKSGKFPAKIATTDIHHDLLHFWQASLVGDSVRRFAHSYQILEYAAFYMVEDDIAKAVRMLLASPDALSQSFDIAARIVEAFGETKLSDPQKIEMAIRKFVDPAVVWDVIQSNREVFSAETKFDGGYTASALIKEKWILSDFNATWCGQFASLLRNMRNALSHGREQRMTSVITPTAANQSRLQPFVPLVAATAREIMLYRKLG